MERVREHVKGYGGEHESVVIQLLGFWNSLLVFYELGDSGLKEEWKQKRIFKSEFFSSVISIHFSLPSMSIFHCFVFLFCLPTAGLF